MTEPARSARLGFGRSPALLIVDMQRDFVAPEAPATCAPMATARLPAIETLLEAARAARIAVFFSQGLVSADRSDIGLWKGAHGRGAVQVEGTPGAEIVPELQPLDGEKVIRKRRPSVFFATDFDVFLRGLHIDTLLLAGSSMSGCVRATAVDAFSRDYRTMIVRECVIDRSIHVMNASLQDMDAKYADVVHLDEVVKYLEGLDPEASGSIL